MTSPTLPLGSRPTVAVVHNLDFIVDDDEVPDGRLAFDYQANADIAEVAVHVSDALRVNGFDPIDVAVRDNVHAALALVREHHVEAVFNLVESIGGDARREPEFPRALAQAGLAYTGNSARALTNALHKDVVRAMLAAHRVPVAKGCMVLDHNDVGAVRRAKLRYPLFIKPAAADGSIGISQESVVTDEPALIKRVRDLEQFVAGPYVVEEYLPGPEINVAILPTASDVVLVPTLIDFGSVPSDRRPIVSYACKWDQASPEYAARTVPLGNEVSLTTRRAVLDTAEAAFYVIGGTSYGRVDLRLDARGRPRVIDVNPNPDLHPEAGFAVAMRGAQIPYARLIDTIVHQAVRNTRPHVATPVRSRPRTARCAFAVG